MELRYTLKIEKGFHGTTSDNIKLGYNGDGIYSNLKTNGGKELHITNLVAEALEYAFMASSSTFHAFEEIHEDTISRKSFVLEGKRIDRVSMQIKKIYQVQQPRSSFYYFSNFSILPKDKNDK